MADSLGQAWRDLNDLLEYRRLLLERAVAFHQQVAEVGFPSWSGIIFTLNHILINIIFGMCSVIKRSQIRRKKWKKTCTRISAALKIGYKNTRQFEEVTDGFNLKLLNFLLL